MEEQQINKLEKRQLNEIIGLDAAVCERIGNEVRGNLILSSTIPELVKRLKIDRMPESKKRVLYLGMVLMKMVIENEEAIDAAGIESANPTKENDGPKTDESSQLQDSKTD